MIECVGTGLVYRNPRPHLRAVNAWHPSIVSLGERELLCAFDLGQAVESLDYTTHAARSTDYGQTWTPPQRLFEDPQDRLVTHTVRIARPDETQIVGFGARFYRDDPEEGLTNRQNLGFVEMDLIAVRSSDGGRTWQGPNRIDPPLVGPAFEICHAILPLADGRWLAPTLTWRGWDGDAPNGMRAIALVSKDRGRTWTEWLDVMDGRRAGILHLEQSMVQLPDGRLLAVAWAYEEASGETKPTPYVLSSDGQTFSDPRPTGLRGQTAKILSLPDGRVLCLYRRHDEPGLWGNLSRLDGSDWVNLGETPLWTGAASGMAGQDTTSAELARLQFGFPSLILRPEGDVLAVFWCHEDGVNNIRWVRIRV
jgi:hypothetical protein